MRINNINSQNTQNFGMALKIKGGERGAKKVADFLSNFLQDDVKSANEVADTFRKVETEQANNPLLDIKISKANPAELDSMDETEYLKAEIVNKKSGHKEWEEWQHFDVIADTDGLQKYTPREDAENTIKWLEKANNYANNRATVMEIFNNLFK